MTGTDSDHSPVIQFMMMTPERPASTLSRIGPLYILASVCIDSKGVHSLLRPNVLKVSTSIGYLL
jgi:hypothetical protein